MNSQIHKLEEVKKYQALALKCIVRSSRAAQRDGKDKNVAAEPVHIPSGIGREGVGRMLTFSLP